MSQKVTENNLVELQREGVVHAAQSLIAVSSILGAVCDQYIGMGSFSVGAVVHVRNVVDDVIDKLDLTGFLIDEQDMPF